MTTLPAVTLDFDCTDWFPSHKFYDAPDVIVHNNPGNVTVTIDAETPHITAEMRIEGRGDCLLLIWRNLPVLPHSATVSPILVRAVALPSDVDFAGAARLSSGRFFRLILPKLQESQFLAIP